MRGITSWSYTPFKPFDRIGEVKQPFICRVAPYLDYCEIEFKDLFDDGAHTLLFRKRDAEKWDEIPLSESTYTIKKLEEQIDYEIAVRRESDGILSLPRLFTCGEIQGVVTNYLHKDDPIYSFSGRFLCSPSILVLPSGKILVSMDVYAGKCPENLTIIMESTDGGKTFSYLCELFPCFWGKLFLHKGEVYMFSTSTEYGELLIGKSTDEGKTFCPPTRLFNGGGGKSGGTGCHKAPMPVISHKGRLWTAVDHNTYQGRHGNGFVSVDENSDLLDAANWNFTEVLRWDDSWPGMSEGESTGFLEGNAVIGPDGELYNVLRYNTASCKPSHYRSGVYRGFPDDPDRKPEFYKVIDFEGGSNNKFDLIFDEVSGFYISVGCEIINTERPGVRNILSLSCSKELDNFRFVKRVVDVSHLDWDTNWVQYASIATDGDDLLVLVRTSANGAVRGHDANYQTLHRVENFRQYLK